MVREPKMNCRPQRNSHCDRAARSEPSLAAQVGGTDAARSEGSAGHQRASQGKSARLTQRIARGIAGVDRHQAWAARRAADDQAF